jgi:hypothetical protein
MTVLVELYKNCNSFTIYFDKNMLSKNNGELTQQITIFQTCFNRDIYIYTHIHILRRNCLLKEIIEGKIKGRIEVTRRRGRRRKQLLDDLGDRRGYCHLKEEALDRIKWRNRFGRGCGPVVCQMKTDE